MKTLRILFILLFSLLIYSGTIHAQGLKVKSPYPDLKVKVTGCREAGDDVLVNLILENIGTQDVDFSICGGFDKHTVIIDDEGNQIKGENILVKIGNDYYNRLFRQGKLLSEVPLKVTVKIEEVPEYVNSIARLNLWFQCSDWQVYEEHIQISNIPISRDGEE